MKILLVRFQKRVGAIRTIPWHFSFFKDILEDRGHTVDIIDNQVEGYSIEETIETVLKEGYQLVGTGGIGTVYREVGKFYELLKSKKPQVKIVVGGQIVADYEFIIDTCPIDILVLGEGEITLSKIVECLERNGNLHEVPGIAFKRNGCLFVTKSEKVLSMDELPDYNFKNIKMEKYDTEVPVIHLIDERARLLKKQGHKCLTVFLARGCPYNCFFCYRHVKGYRNYSNERLEYIIEDLKRRKYSFLFFADECLTANRTNFKKLCELTKKHEIYWQTNGRIDHINHETLKMLKESNCVGVQYGVESFDNYILNNMNKKIKAQKNIEGLNLNYQYGLKTVLQLVIGAPGEDRNTIFNTRKGMWSCYFNIDKTACAILNPYPGSQAYYYGIEKGYIKNKEQLHNEFSDKGKITINFTKLSDIELNTWQLWLPCEAAISYRVKHLTLKVDKTFILKFYSFARKYVFLLLKEPSQFIMFNIFLFKGFSYWFTPVKRLKWNSFPNG